MITSECFPTPHLALRTSDPAALARVQGFAVLQAECAQRLRARLAAALRADPGHRAVRMLLRRLYRDALQWRYDLAVASAGLPGTRGLAHDPERFRTTLSAGGANFDRLGAIGFLREGSVWDPVSRTYRGGQDTPASVLMRHYGAAAQARFATEGCDPGRPDVLSTTVTVPHTGVRIRGNRLVRGAAAREVAAQLVQRIRARGLDTSGIESGGDPVYAVTADPRDAARLRAAAFDLLATAFTRPPQERMWMWQHARFALFQGLAMKKGSDATTRVFLVAVGAVLLAAAPVIEHDADLRCMVLGQDAALDMPADRLLPAEPVGVWRWRVEGETYDHGGFRGSEQAAWDAAYQAVRHRYRRRLYEPLWITVGATEVTVTEHDFAAVMTPHLHNQG
ncbi:hypothetical protein [Amycolatopsis panacis]|uniref:Uncharacterized protein n=1 Tax=Amycolatopsis panacis TaxID=2340917 RepID=A0A419I3G9_9PSEU|nr:hypothetical protein [Amycolatopsis panacis]RJQ84751.1 hypothetical protein D5S19_15920 [Amycolatopsis panacis]